MKNALNTKIDNHLLLKTNDNRIIATQKGIHILNQIIETLMIDK